jgi:hypothetical protein
MVGGQCNRCEEGSAWWGRDFVLPRNVVSSASLCGMREWRRNISPLKNRAYLKNSKGVLVHSVVHRSSDDCWMDFLVELNHLVVLENSRIGKSVLTHGLSETAAEPLTLVLISSKSFQATPSLNSS